MQRYEQELGRPIGPEEREEYRESLLDPSEFEITVPKEMTFAALGAGDQLAPLFDKVNWYLMTAAEGLIITSDNPLVREVHRGTVHPIYGDMGFLNPTAEITFPLSPTKPRDLVQLANTARAAQSDQYLYASVKHPEIERLAAQFRDSRPTVKTEGIGPKKFARASVVRRRSKSVRPAPADKKRRDGLSTRHLGDQSDLR